MQLLDAGLGHGHRAHARARSGRTSRSLQLCQHLQRQGQHADGQLGADARARRMQLEAALVGQHPRRADGRMAREGQLHARREDAQPVVGPGRPPGLAGRQHEGRLGQVHLAGQRLHLVLAEAIGIHEHGQRVAMHGAVGEDIHLAKSKASCHAHSLGRCLGLPLGPFSRARCPARDRAASSAAAAGTGSSPAGWPPASP